MAFNYGNNQIPRPELMDYERVGHLPLGGPSHSGSVGVGSIGYRLEYDKEMYPTVPLTQKSPNGDLTDDETDEKEPIIKKLFSGEKVIFFFNNQVVRFTLQLNKPILFRILKNLFSVEFVRDQQKELNTMQFHAIHVECFLEELFLSKEPFEILKIA